jgi:DNA-directed RNA polymerase subunit beta'
MAIELFKPFVMKRLVDLSHAQNIKSAKRMVERAVRPEVWDVLEEVIAEHPVLLNRAPTLHRLGIQAFEPQLIEGKAIQIHPLVCTAFNADFDGDQMAVHLPLSAEAQAEARILMLSTNNILKPSDGRPVTMPTQDMIIGLFFLTRDAVGPQPGDGRAFASPAEAIMAFDKGELKIQSSIKIRLEGVVPPAGYPVPEGWTEGEPLTLETTLGRVIFNETLPADYPFVNSEAGKKQVGAIVNDLAERYTKVEVANALDALKDAGYYWATRSGVTISIEDVVTPAEKPQILAKYDELAAKVQKQFDRGLITDDERRQELIEIWTQASNDVAKALEGTFEKTNPIFTMVHSGARGNMMQVRQIGAMRGLVANPKGEIIPRPIKSNFREGLSVLEYFISTHGARKGLADTALRTADSGYLTRRLVDVSQDVIIREDDCGTERGMPKVIGVKGADGVVVKDENAETSAYARTAAVDIVHPTSGEVLAPAGSDLGDVTIDQLVEAGVETVKVRSVLTCDAKTGTCAKCYGRSLATGKLVDIGEAVGIIAAQSIGEPGTQLTMRTFHTGGVASADDITQGLPRVVELFEARQPKGKAPIAEAAGRIEIEDTDKARKLLLTPDDGSEVQEYPVSKRARLTVEDGQHVEVGSKLTVGTEDPQDVLRVLGVRKAQEHLVDQVQQVYRSQGVSIHDKHIEIIVRQMLRRITVIESGETKLLPSDLVDRVRFEEENRSAVAEGRQPASGRPVLMGITKASLATESWLSAASFQETTRVLTDAAINAKSDSLLGLKENVILGKLIPAGTGLERYRNIRVEPTEEARASAYAVTGYSLYEDDYFGGGSGQSVPLDDFDFGSYQN